MRNIELTDLIGNPTPSEETTAEELNEKYDNQHLVSYRRLAWHFSGMCLFTLLSFVTFYHTVIQGQRDAWVHFLRIQIFNILLVNIYLLFAFSQDAMVFLHNSTWFQERVLGDRHFLDVFSHSQTSTFLLFAAFIAMISQNFVFWGFTAILDGFGHTGVFRLDFLMFTVVPLCYVLVDLLVVRADLYSLPPLSWSLYSFLLFGVYSLAFNVFQATGSYIYHEKLSWEFSLLVRLFSVVGPLLCPLIYLIPHSILKYRQEKLRQALPIYLSSEESSNEDDVDEDQLDP